RANIPTIDAVLCSTATRTRQTLTRTGIAAPVRYVDRIYDATPGTVIDVINGVESQFGADVSTVLLIGHEPAMSATALGLSDGSNTAVAQEISLKFPTSAIAVLRTSGPWQELSPGGAELVDFHVPR